MAKQIVLDFEGVPSRFDFTPLRRDQLYGKRRRLALDESGQPCTRASLLQDGSLLLRSGMTAQAYFTPDLQWVAAKDLEGLGVDGQPAPMVPSTLDVAQELIGPVSATEVLDLSITAMYVLHDAEVSEALRRRLQAGDIFRFAFNFRDDFRAETALLLANDNGIFAHIGYPSVEVWNDLATAAAEESAADESEDIDDLDFEMF